MPVKTHLRVLLSMEVNGIQVQLITRIVKGKLVYEVTTEYLKSFYRIDCKDFKDGADRFKFEVNRVINQTVKKVGQKL